MERMEVANFAVQAASVKFSLVGRRVCGKSELCIFSASLLRKPCSDCQGYIAVGE